MAGNPFASVVNVPKDSESDANPFSSVVGKISDASNPFAHVLAPPKPVPSTLPATPAPAVGASLSGPNDSTVKTLQNAGFTGDSLRKAWAIVQRESGGNPAAFNGNTGTGDRSYGLAQINMLGSLGPARMKQYGLKSERDLLDPNINARVMFEMSKGGKDFGAWAIGPNAYKGAPSDAYAKFKSFYDQWPGSGTASASSLPAKPGQVAQNVLDLAARYGAQVTSGYRSPQRQAELYANRSAPGSVGAPGKSYHNFGRAVDIAPNAAARSLAAYALKNPGQFRELFFDPLGWYIKNGKIVKGSIGGHSDHLHFAL